MTWTSDDLDDLHRHWGEVYRFSCNGEVWSAVPLADPADVLVADSADGIRHEVRRHTAPILSCTCAPGTMPRLASAGVDRTTP